MQHNNKNAQQHNFTYTFKQLTKFKYTFFLYLKMKYKKYFKIEWRKKIEISILTKIF